MLITNVSEKDLDNLVEVFGKLSCGGEITIPEWLLALMMSNPSYLLEELAC